jgi:hypothetical protein
MCKNAFQRPHSILAVLSPKSVPSANYQIQHPGQGKNTFDVTSYPNIKTHPDFDIMVLGLKAFAAHDIRIVSQFIA